MDKQAKIFISVCCLLLVIFIKGSEEEPTLLWTQRAHVWSKIRGIWGEPKDWIFSKSRHYVQSKNQEGSGMYALDYDPVDKELVWSDKTHREIYRQSLQDSIHQKVLDGIQKVFSDTSTEVNGLAVDWQSGNVYWTDANYRWVAMAPKNSAAESENKIPLFRILVSTRLSTPTGIVVDPYHGHVYWADVGNEPRIEFCQMDGSRRQLLVWGNDIGKPMGLTIDYGKDKLYWADPERGAVEEIGLNSRQRRVVIQAPNRQFLDVLVYGNYVFATSHKHFMLDVYNLTSGALVKQNAIDAKPFFMTLVPGTQERSRNDCPKLNCSQLCVSKRLNVGMCLCRQGFYLELDGRTCTTSQPEYIYSVGHTIIGATATFNGALPHVINLKMRPIVTGRKKIKSIAVDYWAKLLFFADSGDGMIFYGGLDNSSWSTVTAGTKNVGGLAVDYLGGNLYWTDTEKDYIMVSNQDGRYHHVLLEGVGKAHGITLDAVTRWLFWPASRNGVSTIESARLDGTDQRTFVATDIKEPTAIVADPRTKRLYWADKDNQGEIETISYDRTDRFKVQPYASVGALHGITIFQDYITWTDGGNNPKFGFQQTTEKLDEVYYTGTDLSFTQTYDITTFDVYSQPAPSDLGSCLNNNGGCDHLCFTRDVDHTCGCAIGYKLQQDGTSCLSERVYTDFLMFVDPYHKQVYQMQDGKFMTEALPLPIMDQPTSMDYDSHSDLVYWIDLQQQRIKTAHLDGSGEWTIRKFSMDYSKPEMIRVNPVTKYLYFTDSMDKGIFRMKTDGTHFEKIVGSVVHPYGLAVDHDSGNIYWTDLGTKKVERAKDDGSGRSDILHDLKAPVGLALYVEEKALFISDEDDAKIYKYDLTNQVPSVIFEDKTKQIHALAVSNSSVFFTCWNNNAIYMISEEGDAVVLDKPVFARISDLTAYGKKIVVTPPTLLPTSATGESILEDNKVLIIIAAAGAAAILLLLLLLVVCVAVCRTKKRKSSEEEDEEEGVENTAFENNEYTHIRDSQPPDIVASSSIDQPGPSEEKREKRDIHKTYRSSANVSISTEHVIKTIDGEMASIDKYLTSSDDEITAADGSGGTTPYTAISTVSTVGFRIEDNGQVATVIQRVVAKLRKGLGSVRWSQGDERPTIIEDREQKVKGKGKQKKKLKKKVKREEMKPQPKPIGREQPSKSAKGFAPAGHTIPAGHVKQTWSKLKLGQ